jgi:hypothetical protein
MREVFGSDARVSLVVEEVTVDHVGGFALRCSLEFVFEVFPNSAPAAHVETEFWRVSSPGTDAPHSVTAGFSREA